MGFVQEEPKPSDHVSQAFEYLSRAVSKAATGTWPEGTFRVTKSASTVYVDKPSDDRSLPDAGLYTGQIIAIVVPPKAGMAGEYSHSGDTRSFSSIQFENALRRLAELVHDDIKQWAMP